jgi:hypothetical protein
MKRGRSTGTPTKAQAAMHAAIRDAGCVVARMRGLGFIPCAVHHLTTGGRHGQKRLGHDFVVGLNDWSHQGYPLTQYGWDADECKRRLGPSYAKEPAAFRALYPDDELIARQRELLGMEAAA